MEDEVKNIITIDKYEKGKKHTRRHKRIKMLLKKNFDYDQFKPNQYLIINQILNGFDVCAVLPTGYGKSLTFQIPAIYLNKPAIIVCPLISLMEDQEIILKKLGLKSVCYNSNLMNKVQVRSDILNGKYNFVYITPESVIGFDSFLKKLNENLGISLIAIDEAHCISAYGYDFRPSYRNLTFFKEILPDVPIIALTATATPIVAKDICDVLQLETKDGIIQSSFDRSNLYIEINKRTKELSKDLLPLVKKYVKKGAVIIYCLTIKDTEKIATFLKAKEISCAYYHGKLGSEKRSKIHKKFIKGEYDCIVATNAFGMGINKIDVRLVIHYGCPRNLESYYQEIGRAGRDLKNSFCYLFFSPQDFIIQQYHIDRSESKDPEYKKNQYHLLQTMKDYVKSNVCRKKYILNYFQEKKDGNCGKCDICVPRNGDEVQDVKTKDVSKEVILLLKVMTDALPFSYNSNGFGGNMYIDIIRGSNGKKITLDMKKIHGYGKGINHSKDWWKELIDHLIKDEFIARRSVSRWGISVLEVTPTGENLLSNDARDKLLDGDGDIIPKYAMTTTK